MGAILLAGTLIDESNPLAVEVIGGEVGGGTVYTLADPLPVTLASADAETGVDAAPLSVQQAALTETVDTVKNAPLRAAGAALSNVASSATVVDLLAANVNRRGAMVQNDTDKTLYLKLGTAASATSYTVALGPKDANGVGDYYELPQPVYVGLITGIWAAGPTGSARVTELT